MTIPATLDDRLQLQRWIAAIGLTAAGEDAGRLDTVETNALSLLAAYAACEALLGLLGGTRPYKRGEEVTFPTLMRDAEANVRLEKGLKNDLLAVYRMRNDFVHAGNTVHTNEAARATSAARRLLDVVPGQMAMAATLEPRAGIASAIAAIIDVPVVGLWLREADQALAADRLEYAAECCARVLDAVLRRAKPRLHTDTDLSTEVSFSDMRRLSGGMGFDRHARNLAVRIEGLQEWIVPLALGMAPAAYAWLRSVVGQVSGGDLGGYPTPVERRGEPPAGADVRKALSTVSELVYRMWAIGSLRSFDDDERIVELAMTYVAAESGTPSR